MSTSVISWTWPVVSVKTTLNCCQDPWSSTEIVVGLVKLMERAQLKLSIWTLFRLASKNGCEVAYLTNLLAKLNPAWPASRCLDSMLKGNGHSLQPIIASCVEKWQSRLFRVKPRRPPYSWLWTKCWTQFKPTLKDLWAKTTKEWRSRFVSQSTWTLKSSSSPSINQRIISNSSTSKKLQGTATAVQVWLWKVNQVILIWIDPLEETVLDCQPQELRWRQRSKTVWSRLVTS